MPVKPIINYEFKYPNHSNKIWKEEVTKIKEQFGIKVEKNDRLIRIDTFNVEDKKITGGLSNRLRWIMLTNGTDKYEKMTEYLPESFLKMYKKGDTIKLHHIPSGKDIEFVCSVRNDTLAWEK